MLYWLNLALFFSIDNIYLYAFWIIKGKLRVILLMITSG